MPDIEPSACGGMDTILNEDWASLSSAGSFPQAVEEFLENFGWDGMAAAAVKINLSKQRSGHEYQARARREVAERSYHLPNEEVLAKTEKNNGK